LGRLARTARSRGLRGFTARVLAENARVMALLRGLGGRLQSRLEDGAYAVTVLF
jgi:hypothetical protein